MSTLFAFYGGFKMKREGLGKATTEKVLNYASQKYQSIDLKTLSFVTVRTFERHVPQII